ncbi:hypothetical protein [Vibrio harveyi]|uniref:hypothetical protein n=1 Tax=Vibrio harveyi TaxID=669 RepID=UPI003CF77C40
MKTIDYMFMQAGIRFFAILDGSTQISTIAIERDAHKTLRKVEIRKCITKKIISTKGLRSLKKLSDYSKSPITPFKYMNLHVKPTSAAKRELSSLKLGLNMPSLTPASECLDNLIGWRSVRLEKKLPVDVLDETILILSALTQKTPRELISMPEIRNLKVIISKLESWHNSRKSKRLSIKPLRRTIKVFKDHEFILSKFIDNNLSCNIY